MTGSVVPVPHPGRMDDPLIELAILGVLAERTEIYPSHLVGELRRRAPGIPPAGVRVVLERLWEQRRVARLWHRYMLPGQVATVRDKWLAMIERRRGDYEALEASLNAYEDGRAILLAWDGWRVGEVVA
jgi:hypothetical protein